MEEKKEEVKQINEEELLKKVEKAAQKGARKASFKQILLSALPTLIAIGLLAYFIVPKVEMLNTKFNSVFISMTVSLTAIRRSTITESSVIPLRILRKRYWVILPS